MEITFPVMTYLNFGLSYSKRVISKDELSNGASTDHEIEINQDVADFVAQIPFYKSNINDNVSTVDLSGSYFKIGLMFDGIPTFAK